MAKHWRGKPEMNAKAVQKCSFCGNRRLVFPSKTDPKACICAKCVGETAGAFARYWSDAFPPARALELEG
jgi:hypothetical protein